MGIPMTQKTLSSLWDCRGSFRSLAMTASSSVNPHPCACIRCTGVFSMLCRKKPSARQRRFRRYIRRIAVLALILLIYFEIAVRVQLGEVICTELRTLAEKAVNAAVSDFLAGNSDIGERLTALHLSDSGSVSAVTTDPAYINYVKATICERAQENIDALARERGIEVPLGSFSGVTLFEHLGPAIRLGIDSRQTVSCTFKSAFESAGVNQTLHHITMHVDVAIAVYNPFRIRRGVQISSDFEIAQTVIVGSVPTYGGVVTY